MSQARKRFYKEAAFGIAEGGFAILLDGRSPRTPGGRPFIVPSEGLAREIAQEWAAQETAIQPATMPLTQLAATALDRVAGERASMEAALIKFAATDLLCYRATTPAELVAKQSGVWQPLLDWAALSLDAPLAVTSGVLPIGQPDHALKALERWMQRLDLWRLAAFQCAAGAAGSFVLGAALIESRLDALGMIEAAQLDETYQRAHWGEDYEATLRLERQAADIRAASELLNLLAGGV
jgi:chaperone required for assembly of F1-ATPase